MLTDRPKIDKIKKMIKLYESTRPVYQVEPIYDKDVLKGRDSSVDSQENSKLDQWRKEIKQLKAGPTHSRAFMRSHLANIYAIEHHDEALNHSIEDEIDTEVNNVENFITELANSLRRSDFP